MEGGSVGAAILAKRQRHSHGDVVGPGMPETRGASLDVGRCDHRYVLIEWQMTRVVYPAEHTGRDGGPLPDRHGMLSLRVRFPLPAWRARPLHDRGTHHLQCADGTSRRCNAASWQYNAHTPGMFHGHRHPCSPGLRLVCRGCHISPPGSCFATAHYLGESCRVARGNSPTISWQEGPHYSAVIVNAVSTGDDPGVQNQARRSPSHTRSIIETHSLLLLSTNTGCTHDHCKCGRARHR
jgi:hypothetical protein